MIGIKDELSAKEKRLGFILILPTYFYFGVYIISFVFLFFITLFNLQLDNNSLNAYFNLVYDVFLALICLFLLRNFVRKSLETFKKTAINDVIWTIIKGFPLLYFCQIVANLIMLQLTPNSDSVNQTAIVELLDTNLLPLLITTVIIAPILEELVFRGIIFNTLYFKSKTLAYFFSSFLFGFMHVASAMFTDGNLSEFIFIIPYAVMGFVFSYVYDKRGNIVVPILLHILNNLFSVVLIFL